MLLQTLPYDSLEGFAVYPLRKCIFINILMLSRLLYRRQADHEISHHLVAGSEHR
jgi:hypothetical protein